jgi:hypothetical protein
MLHKSGLVISHAVGQGKPLRRRGETKKRKEWISKLSNIFAIRFRGIDPERILNGLLPWFGWLFTTWCLALALVLGLAAITLVLVNYQEFRSKLPTFETFFAAQNWLYLGLTMAAVKVLHEFGHGLHHMLTKVDDYSISGIKGVEWDAVELPSQFMENFCWEWDVVKHMTEHVDTKAPLPEALFKKMIAAKNFQSGMQTLRQIEFSLFDIRLHTEYNDKNKINPLELLEAIRDEIAVIRPPSWNRFPNSFSHIFAGGYAAGYYSYKWAEVLASDAFSLFEEEGVLSSIAGQKFQNEVLAKGGSRPAMESFIAFRGREPSVDALLRHSGMA